MFDGPYPSASHTDSEPSSIPHLVAYESESQSDEPATGRIRRLSEPERRAGLVEVGREIRVGAGDAGPRGDDDPSAGLAPQEHLLAPEEPGFPPACPATTTGGDGEEVASWTEPNGCVLHQRAKLVNKVRQVARKL